MYVLAGTDVRNDAEDHALMFSVAHGCRIEIWHVGQVNGSVAFSNVAVGASEISDFDDAVVDIAFSPDSTAVAVASLDGYVRFYMVKNPVNQTTPSNNSFVTYPDFRSTLVKKTLNYCTNGNLMVERSFLPLFSWTI